MINIFVTHYVRVGSDILNDVTADVVRELSAVTDTPHTLTVLGWAETDELWVDLEKKLSIQNVRVIRNDRDGRPDIQPSQRNKVLEIAALDGDNPFVLLHNDVRPAIEWLDRLAKDLSVCEERWGTGSSVIAPRYIPFHRTDSAVWDVIARHGRACKTAEEIGRWCGQYGFPFLLEQGRIHCPPWAPPTDNGHQLMMFITRPSFFDKVGLCDEAYTGSNYDDSEWGMRALMVGKKNLLSQTALVGHAEGLSFGVAKPLNPVDNEKVFIEKWGQSIFDELFSGRIWTRLHNGGSGDARVSDGLGG